MKYKRTIQQVRVLAVLLYLAVFLVLNSIVHLQIRHYKNEEQLAATIRPKPPSAALRRSSTATFPVRTCSKISSSPALI